MTTEEYTTTFRTINGYAEEEKKRKKGRDEKLKKLRGEFEELFWETSDEKVPNKDYSAIIIMKLMDIEERLTRIEENIR